MKNSEFAGQFYPATKKELSQMIDKFLANAKSTPVLEEVLMLISPHAGYGFSGQTAAYGYKLIKERPYKTVIILGTSHQHAFNGAAVSAADSFSTSLGRIEVDQDFVKSIVGIDPELFINNAAFNGEHSVEVQLPFLQKVLTDFKIVPVILSDATLESCKKIARIFKTAIGARKDILLVVSTDLYHGYDYQEAETVDARTMDLMRKLDDQGLYYALRDQSASACGGFAAVVGLNIAKELGYSQLEVLQQSNSARVTGNLAKGDWTVGYVSAAVGKQKIESLLTLAQKQKLLRIAREAISTYLKTGQKLQISESSALLSQKMGAFVTLNLHHELRGCIGNLVGQKPLYLTIRDMAIAAAVDDPRFGALTLAELKNITIEISVLSILKRVASAQEIQLGRDGVLVQKGNQSGVFLPQVATETGWSKEEFLDNLCAHKAGLPKDAWKDKATQIYTFTAEVFSENEVNK